VIKVVAWWWVLIAFAAGETAGLIIAAFLAANEPKSKYIRR